MDQAQWLPPHEAVERREAQGEFPLRQSELGLKPFSAAMGALVVLDEMHIRFEITARE